MQLAQNTIDRTCPESNIYNAAIELDNRNILELGCGGAEMTRDIATGGRGRSVLALEVDKVQHAKNLQIADLPNVRFELAGAESIPAADESFDVVFMFKSLHHVPVEWMAQALEEVRRVLKPGGHAYISEPVFSGDFNEVLRLFHDEEAVRKSAFAALKFAVETGRFELREEIFFNSVVEFADFEAFEKRVIQATHSTHRLSEDTYAKVRKRFAEKRAKNGGRFTVPIRVDLLRKPT